MKEPIGWPPQPVKTIQLDAKSAGETVPVMCQAQAYSIMLWLSDSTGERGVKPRNVASHVRVISSTCSSSYARLSRCILTPKETTAVRCGNSPGKDVSDEKERMRKHESSVRFSALSSMRDRSDLSQLAGIPLIRKVVRCGSRASTISLDVIAAIQTGLASQLLLQPALP